MITAYLCLGSNIGDRVGFIQQAASFLGENESINILNTSSFYETQPWLEVDTSWFVNAVVEIKTSLSPQALLDECLRIEHLLGRIRDEKNSSLDRTLDIDILFYGDEIIEEENLIIPHKFVHKRAFTLVPMLELNPDYVHPKLNKSVEKLHSELVNPEMVFLYGTRVEDAF